MSKQVIDRGPSLVGEVGKDSPCEKEFKLKNKAKRKPNIFLMSSPSDDVDGSKRIGCYHGPVVGARIRVSEISTHVLFANQVRKKWVKAEGLNY